MATPLTTLAAVKDVLQIEAGVTTDSGVLNRLIAAVSEHFATYMERDIMATDYDVVFDGTGTPVLVLGAYPIRQVYSVEVGPPVSRRLLQVNQDYVATKTAVKLLYGKFYMGVANVRVRWRAGFDHVPYDISEAAAKTVAYRYKQFGRLGQMQKVMGNETVTFETTSFTQDVKDVLDKYHRVVQVDVGPSL